MHHRWIDAELLRVEKVAVLCLCEPVYKPLIIKANLGKIALGLTLEDDEKENRSNDEQIQDIDPS